MLVQACSLRGPDASGTLEGAGGARGVLAVLKDASSWKAVAADTLGNVLALAGTGGDFARRTFDPWGNPLTRDAAGNLRASTLQERRADYDALPLAWASQEVDPDTGLTHYHFREYSPSLGGWLTQDPIGLAGGYLNLRSYLGNRPADALDKEGRFAWGLLGVVIGGAIGYYNTGTLEGAAKGALVVGVAMATFGAGAVLMGAEVAATTSGMAFNGAVAGFTSQVADNIFEGVPVDTGVVGATMTGAASGALIKGVNDAVSRAYNPCGPVPKMVPPTRATPRQAAESSAAKQSVAAAEGTQADALKRKVIEEAKKLPCPESVKAADVAASTPVGRLGSPLGSIEGNTPSTIAGRDYTAHALDPMQKRGLTPTVVENAVKNGAQSVGNTAAEIVHHDAVNNVTVVTDAISGRVVTVYGGRK